MIEIKRGLDPEVKVSAPLADWKPDHIKVECVEPASFLVIDNPTATVGTIHILP
jgi:hypothetical protein